MNLGYACLLEYFFPKTGMFNNLKRKKDLSSLHSQGKVFFLFSDGSRFTLTTFNIPCEFY